MAIEPASLPISNAPPLVHKLCFFLSFSYAELGGVTQQINNMIERRHAREVRSLNYKAWSSKHEGILSIQILQIVLECNTQVGTLPTRWASETQVQIRSHNFETNTSQKQVDSSCFFFFYPSKPFLCRLLIALSNKNLMNNQMQGSAEALHSDIGV